jgi:hypothetical protein
MTNKASKLLSLLLEVRIELNWIFKVPSLQKEYGVDTFEINSLFWDGKILKLWGDCSGNLYGNKDFLDEFKHRLFQRGVEGDISYADKDQQRPAKLIGATDRFSRKGVRNPVYIDGYIALKIDDEVVRDLNHWWGRGE